MAENLGTIVVDPSFKRATEPTDPTAALRGMLASSPSPLAANAPKKEKTPKEGDGASQMLQGSPEEVMQNTMKAGYAQLLMQGILKGTDPQTIAGNAKEAAAAIHSILGAVPGTVAPTPQAQPTPQPSETVAPEKPKGKYQTKPASSPFGFGGATLDAEGNLIEQQPGFIAGTLAALVGGTAKASAAMDVNKMAKVQKLTGEEPMQKGERERLGLDYAKDIALKEIEATIKGIESGQLKPEHIYNKFEAASVPFITARDAHARLEEAAKDPSAAGDLALLYNYMKVLDPGSTVRESEFATAAAAGSIPAQIKGSWEKVVSGKRLDTKVREDFVDRSRRLFKGMEHQQKKTTAEFSRLAKENGIDFKKVIRDTGIAEEQGVTEGTTATNPKTGQKLTYRGGKWQ